MNRYKPSKKYVEINFDYLNDASDGDIDFIKEILSASEFEFSGFLVEFKNYCQQKKHIEIGSILHKIKPSVIIYNLSIVDLITTYSSYKEEMSDELLNKLLTEITPVIELALKEIKEELEYLSDI